MGPLLKNRTVVLVTHHVELVLPGTHYLVRMLDGRIDTQGLVKDLREKGVLEEIAQDEEAEAHAEDLKNAKEADPEEEEEGKAADADKKPRKLIKDEHRETGGVKWNIYKKYLQASYVSAVLARLYANNTFCSSYIIWVILLLLVFLSQGLGIIEKLWIKVCLLSMVYVRTTDSHVFATRRSGVKRMATSRPARTHSGALWRTIRRS